MKKRGWENLHYIEKDKVSNIVVNQIQIKHLLDMIKKEEPDMESQFLGFQQFPRDKNYHPF